MKKYFEYICIYILTIFLTWLVSSLFLDGYLMWSGLEYNTFYAISYYLYTLAGLIGVCSYSICKKLNQLNNKINSLE